MPTPRYGQSSKPKASTMSGVSGPQFEADIKAQIERWARIVKATGFKAD